MLITLSITTTSNYLYYYVLLCLPSPPCGHPCGQCPDRRPWHLQHLRSWPEMSSTGSVSQPRALGAESRTAAWVVSDQSSWGASGYSIRQFNMSLIGIFLSIVVTTAQTSAADILRYARRVLPFEVRYMINDHIIHHTSIIINYVYIYIYIYISLYLSLSIYIYMYTHVY